MNQVTSTQKAQPEMIALFVSDTHLKASMDRTAQAFFEFLSTQVPKAQQLYLLGDLFEYWAGDDDMGTPFHHQVITALRQVKDAGVDLFWMAGNRDFLVSKAFAHATGAQLLADPYVATIAGQKITLTHGDAQCTEDEAYMAFRATVRQEAWQQAFLAMPLEQRKAMIERLRHDSRQAQHTKSDDIMDVNAQAIATLFKTTGTSIMIHGHTHRPACHQTQDGHGSYLRYVLSDWDSEGPKARGGWIGITADGAIKRFNFDGNELI